MIKQDTKETAEQKVVICPSMASHSDGRQIYFLFSLYQIEDIQGDIKVTAVPFSLPYVDGITVWRGTALPVVSLEHYLGLSLVEPGRARRCIILRSSLKTEGNMAETRMVIRADREMRMLPVPESCMPVASNGWVNHEFIKGVFEWEKGFLIVPDTEPILKGRIDDRA